MSRVNRKTTMLAALVLFLLGAAAGLLGTRAYERAQCAKRADAASSAATVNAGALRSGANQWTQALVTGQGEAILRAFVAGVAPLVLAGRENLVEVAGASLLRLTGVQGVTILRADGKVLYASDAKLTVSDAGNDQTKWALTATDFISRDGIRPGVTEMSLPVTDRGKVLAIVWLAYDRDRVREQSRPELLAAR